MATFNYGRYSWFYEKWEESEKENQPKQFCAATDNEMKNFIFG